MTNLYDESYFLNSKFSNYKNYDERSYEQLAKDIIKVGTINPDNHIYDYGCATGKLLSELHKLGFKNVSGYDTSEWAVNHGKELYPKIKNVIGERAFKTDVITCLDVLEHMNYSDLIRTMKHFRNTNPNKLIIRVPVSKRMYGDYVLECSRNDKTHRLRLTKEMWIMLFESFGFMPLHIINEKDIYDSEGVLCLVLDNYRDEDFKADREYFSTRMSIQGTHFMDALDWNTYFKPKKILEIGCGVGPRVYAMNRLGMDAVGIEKSKYAVNSSPAKGRVLQGNITKDQYDGDYDLVIAYDLLEHISYEDIDTVLENIRASGTKNFLFSIPFIGDPNLDADPTHIIKETREWWLNKLAQYFIFLPVPEYFLFKHQLIIGVKK